MNHFFIPPSAITSQRVNFPTETARQMARVLRLKPGEHVLALDNSGYEVEVSLDEITPQQASGSIIHRQLAAGEPRTRLTLYLALTQREKFEWMLQKCTEIGGAAFVPVIMARSLAQGQSEAGHKLERWQKIVQEAAEQSGRGLIPTIQPPIKFAAALQNMPQQDACLLAWEDEHTLTLSAALSNLAVKPSAQVTVIIGPEGGITTDEAAQAKQAGFQLVTLGARILRMETAAIAAAVLTLHALGE